MKSSALQRDSLFASSPEVPRLLRWGTSLEAVGYHAAYPNVLKEFVRNELDAEDSAAISLAQGLFEDPSVQVGAVAIASNFGAIPRTVRLVYSEGSAPR